MSAPSSSSTWVTALTAAWIPDIDMYVPALYRHRLMREGREAPSPLLLVSQIFLALPKYCNYPLLCDSFTQIFSSQKGRFRKIQRNSHAEVPEMLVLQP